MKSFKLVLVRILYTITGLYWLTIFVATHIPTLPAAFGALVLQDKLLHASAFAGLTLLLSVTGAALGRTGVRFSVTVIVILATYAAIDELTQMLFPPRAADLRDWLADVTGAVLGIACFHLLRRMAGFVKRRAPELKRTAC